MGAQQRFWSIPLTSDQSSLTEKCRMFRGWFLVILAAVNDTCYEIFKPKRLFEKLVKRGAPTLSKSNLI